MFTFAWVYIPDVDYATIWTRKYDIFFPIDGDSRNLRLNISIGVAGEILDKLLVTMRGYYEENVYSVTLFRVSPVAK